MAYEQYMEAWAQAVEKCEKPSVLAAFYEANQKRVDDNSDIKQLFTDRKKYFKSLEKKAA